MRLYGWSCGAEKVRIIHTGSLGCFYIQWKLCWNAIGGRSTAMTVCNRQKPRQHRRAWRLRMTWRHLDMSLTLGCPNFPCVLQESISQASAGCQSVLLQARLAQSAIPTPFSHRLTCTLSKRNHRIADKCPIWYHGQITRLACTAPGIHEADQPSR